MNPFMMGPLAMSAWSNPELFSTAMAAQGISPNAITNPNVPPGMDQLDPLAGFMTPSMMPQAAGAAPVADPAAAAPMVPGAAMALSGLGQVSAPKPTPPIMNAGVSGSQKAPEMTVGGQNSAMQAAIAKLLLNQQPGVTPVPGLPGLMKGII